MERDRRLEEAKAWLDGARVDNSSPLLAELTEAAEAARSNSHSPYSKFPVGAALLCSDGRIFMGCNVENASFGVTNCAERTAVFSAVSRGVRKFVACLVTTGNARPVPPCGPCRQVLSEFTDGMVVLSRGQNGTVERWTLADLFPHPMGRWDLE